MEMTGELVKLGNNQSFIFTQALNYYANFLQSHSIASEIQYCLCFFTDLVDFSSYNSVRSAICTVLEFVYLSLQSNRFESDNNIL